MPAKTNDTRHAVVTAGGAGIGNAIVRKLHGEGMVVHAVDVDGKALDGLKAELPGIKVTRVDVADEGQVDALFAQVAEDFGGLDVLVNCAGIAGPTAPVDEIEPEDWRRCVAVNLEGAFLCTRRAVPLMRRRGGGSVVNFSSNAGLFGFANRTPYAAAKWGIIGFTKSVAIEVGGDGIRVNAICPGTVKGARMDAVVSAHAKATGQSEEEVLEGYLSGSSLKSYILAEDIAEMVWFLCSAAGAKVSGQALAVDGHTEHL